MSANNLFETRRKGFVIRTKVVTADYTAKVGSSADNFIVDRVIDVTTTDGTSIEVDIPAGLYEGQRILVNFSVEGNNETLTVDAAKGTDWSITAEGGYCSLEWMNSTVGWIALASYAGE